MNDKATAADPTSRPGTVLVTGGTGNTGSLIGSRLAALGHQVRAGSRRPAPQDERGSLTSPVRFDWHDDTTHATALGGARLLYLVAPDAEPGPERLMVPFLRRAREEGVRRVVLLSSSGIAEGGDGLGAVHRSVRELFPEWAVLRPSWFMQNFVGDQPHAVSIREHDEIVTATADGRVGFVDAADIAEVGVRALADDRPHNTAHLITGPEALTCSEVAATVSTHAGRPVRHRAVAADAMIERLARFGIPEAYAGLLAGLDQAIAAGSESRTSPVVEQVTGRPPRSFADFAAAHAATWQRPAEGTQEAS
ncbi:NAD(P)H-binding protein [Streptomyces sp. N2-109]|uniref:NAD(P)H-binding protein n=1 Tax=Streptomyces gossypii TaxID=2883101 RepID=A0ABT2JR79_9ACTN|nr:NAD(P)H-binding protein [Streptomyces gossypii]MCT2590391.1 NAD(P)H-binding protein [Streptomyces gossypii]